MKVLYANKNRVEYPNQRSFLDGLFLSVGSNLFSYSTDSNAKKVFQTGGGIRPSYKSTVVSPKVENVYSISPSSVNDVAYMTMLMSLNMDKDAFKNFLEIHPDSAAVSIMMKYMI